MEKQLQDQSCVAHTAWWTAWEVGGGAYKIGEVWLPEKTQLHPPSFIGQKKIRHVKDEVELRRRGLRVAQMVGGSLNGEEIGAEIKRGAHRQC